MNSLIHVTSNIININQSKLYSLDIDIGSFYSDKLMFSYDRIHSMFMNDFWSHNMARTLVSTKII
jgi:hypothetical protein